MKKDHLSGPKNEELQADRDASRKEWAGALGMKPDATWKEIQERTEELLDRRQAAIANGKDIDLAEVYNRSQANCEHNKIS